MWFHFRPSNHSKGVQPESRRTPSGRERTLPCTSCSAGDSLTAQLLAVVGKTVHKRSETTFKSAKCAHASVCPGPSARPCSEVHPPASGDEPPPLQTDGCSRSSQETLAPPTARAARSGRDTRSSLTSFTCYYQPPQARKYHARFSVNVVFSFLKLLSSASDLCKIQKLYLLQRAASISADLWELRKIVCGNFKYVFVCVHGSIIVLHSIK